MPFPLPPEVKTLVQEENYDELFVSLNTIARPQGELFKILENVHPYANLETMLALREGENPHEDDGIWHDDGSRVLAFSLSLNLNPETISGGELGFRQKQSQVVDMIPPQAFGNLIIFLTGIHGYEHKVFKVHKGKRLVFVGWCSF